MEWLDHNLILGRCGSVLCEPGWGWDSKIMADFDLWYVWSGHAWATCGDEKWDLTAGSIICFQPGKRYFADQDLSNRLGVCFLHFDFAGTDGQRIELPSNDWPPHFGHVNEVDLYERMSKHAVSLVRTEDPAAKTEAMLYVRCLLAALDRSNRQPAMSGTERDHHDAIWAAARHIRENPGELFSVEALAERVHYSADHFSRLFKQIVQVTPKEFCIRSRMERAQALLRESPMSIEQIATALGYADVFFFSRQFKQRIGMPPSQFRAQK